MSKLNMETIIKMLSPTEGKVKKIRKDKRRSFETYDGYQRIQNIRKASELFKIEDPFFRSFDGVPSALNTAEGEPIVNFASYNYLNLNGEAYVSNAAIDAINRYGTSCSASRMVSGERQIHQELERALAELHGTQNALAFVSGHATNVTTIGYLFGPRDLIIHDEYIHNSAIEGIKLSGAVKLSFPHNDWQALEKCLTLRREQYERILVLIEGHYSMDGDYPELPEFIRIKNQHDAFLMIDEAHSIGVLGKTGRGIGEFFGVNPADVDIWMGTLSKTLAGCGGYIAGSNALIEHLRYLAPGFLYSTAMVPSLAASSLAAIELMLREPERIQSLNKNANLFLTEAKRLGLNTGFCKGLGIIPIICGSSRRAVNLSNQLYKKKISAQPIIFPAVPEQQARLRFFINCTHTEDQICSTVKELHQLTVA